MRIGGQKNLITIRRRIQVGLTKIGEPNWVWTIWREDIFCEVSVSRGKEQFDAATKQRYSEEVWLFRTRYEEVEGIDDAMTLLHEGNLFGIKAIRPDGQYRRDVIVECTLQDAQLGAQPLTIGICSAIDVGYVGEPYEPFSVSASGGAAPYEFAAIGMSLPSGLAIDPSSGEVTGVPTSAGIFTVSLQVVDASGASELIPTFQIEIKDA